MHRFAFAALIAAPLVLAAPAWAATDIPLAPFTAITVHGGGHVILMHGATQRVTMLKGDPKISQLRIVHGNTLDISPCDDSWTRCPQHYELEVQIISPEIQAIDAHGGGAIDAKGDFPKQQQISITAHGGGAIDVRAIPAEQVSATAHGGGAIRVKPLSQLTASVHGGGAISYSGNPKVESSVHGGGAISRE